MPIAIYRDPGRRFVALILPDPGRRTLRFLFEYDGGLRAVCWMNIGPDGSFYLNPRQDGDGPPLHARGLTDDAGGWATVESIELDEAEVQDRKFSYHASGRVKGGSRMTQSVNLREVSESTLIRQDDYAHPSRFEDIDRETMRITDLIIPGQDAQPYRLEEEHPLTSRVFVAPLRAGRAEVTFIDGDPDTRTGQTAVVVPALNLKDCQDLTYQIQFFNRSGDWPDMSSIAVLQTDRGKDAPTPG